jgi:hypothetical protein
MVEAGGISEGGQATAAEDMDRAMAYCGSGGTGVGRRMAEADGKGLLMLTHIRQNKMRLCVSYFASVFTFLVRATMITRTGYFAHTYLLQMPEYAQNKEV